MRNTPTGENDAHEKQKVAPLRTLAARQADQTKQRENRAEKRDENAGAKIGGASLLVSCPTALDQIVECRYVCLAAATAATTQTNLGDAITTQAAAARLARGNRINSRMVVAFHGVIEWPNDPSSATRPSATRWRDSVSNGTHP